MVGSDQEFAFKQINTLDLPSITETDLYIHIPFCKTICPYCPYNKVVYQQELADRYVKAILLEISQYKKLLGKFKVTSIYLFQKKLIYKI